MKSLYSPIFCLLFSSMACFANAQTSYTGPDFSGQYTCTGEDRHEGQYQGEVSMQLQAQYSSGEYAAYVFELSVPGYGKYPGHAAGYKNNLAIYFAHTEHSHNQDFGTGIATFSKNAQGKWSFRKFYYEPEFKGGNTGFETCTQK